MNFDTAEFAFQENEPAVSIIEIGVNHNGSLSLAKQLVDRAQSAGASIVKFQAFVAEEEISRFAEKAEYQKETTGALGGQLEMAKKLELTHAQLRLLRKYCWDVKIPFLCSVFDYVSLDFLIKDMQVKALKIPSSEVTNHPFLAEISRTGVGVILSTGASTLEEVAAALRAISEAGRSEVVLLHCVSNYPAEISQINLNAMFTMKQAFKVPIGFSDHTVGIEVPIIAAAMGAVAIEKHFTLDKNMEGPDHRASIDPPELDLMIRGMKAAFLAKGNGIKDVANCELANRPLIRKSIVSLRELLLGHIIKKEDLGFKRPHLGIAPYDVDKVIGRKIRKSISIDEPIKWQDLE